MIKIIHRVNNSSGLLQIPNNFGVEVDIRNYAERLVLHHEPFFDGELSNEFIKNYNHTLIVLNIKTEGVDLRKG